MTIQVSPYKTKLDPGKAYWMARIANVMYTTRAAHDEHPDEAAILQNLKAEDTGFISVKGADRNSSQAALIEHQDYLCMAFRGTNELADWLDNINAFRERVLFGEFHRGFWHSVEDVWNVVHEEYVRLREEKKRPLFFTGHSLGGAMATVAASRFLHQDLPFTSVYTYGEPRALGKDTARIYNAEAGKRHHRFQNNEDIVTRVPSRLMGYSHVGTCLYIDGDKQIHDDPGFWFRFLDVYDGSLDTLRGQGHVGAVSDHAMDLYQAAVSSWNTTF
jgi:triacylglycerol lipase